jgi:hypothetical protein
MEAAEFATAKSKSWRSCAVEQSAFSLGQVSRRRTGQDAASNNKKRAAPKADPRALTRRRKQPASFLVPTVTALHEQTQDANVRRQAMLRKQ